MSDCQHEQVYWYDKEGIGVSLQDAEYGRCATCQEKIPLVELHPIYCPCERCKKVRERGQ